MKTYRIETANGTYHLSGLIDKVKETIEDIVQANERMALHRQMTKGLLTPEVYTMEKAGIQAMGFASEAVMKFISTPKGEKELFRAMLEHGGKLELVKSDDIQAVIDAKNIKDSDAALTIAAIWTDAYPKATPPSDSTAPAGETNSTPSS